MRHSIGGDVWNRFTTGVIAACCCLAISGCGGGSGTRPAAAGPQGTISGSVTKEGKPVTRDSTITFFCPEAAATLGGKIDSLGKFSLRPADPAIGIPPGRYQVMIRPPAPPAPQVGTDAYKSMMMGGDGSVDKKPAPPSDIPDKFQALDTSEITLEVKAGPNTFDIDLAKLPQ
jgi:hypothetical protein